MGFIPEGAQWYLADLILEHTIDGDPRNVVHVNTHLIEARSPEEAYRKANELGRAGEMDYANTDGKQVRITFRGLWDLDVIHEELVDGAELFYKEVVGMSDAALKQYAKTKEDLSVFAPMREKSGVPNYLPEEFAGLAEIERTSRESGSGLPND